MNYNVLARSLDLINGDGLEFVLYQVLLSFRQ